MTVWRLLSVLLKDSFCSSQPYLVLFHFCATKYLFALCSCSCLGSSCVFMEGRKPWLVITINITLVWKKWLSPFQHWWIFSLSTEIWWVGLNWGLMKECELKDRGTATVLHFSALLRATLFPAHYVLFPSKHSCSLQCLAPWSPRNPLAQKAGRKGPESSRVTRTRCTYSSDFCSFWFYVR